MSYLNRDQILQAEDLPTQAVEVPEWGGEVLVRGMSGTERDAWEVESVRFDKNGQRLGTDFSNIRAKLVGRCMIGEDGDRVFSDRDIGLLGAKSAAALDRVCDVAQRLSGITAEDIEELEGN